jgi:hypothetical protein
VVAAAAAARRRRLNQVLDAFRLAGATAPDRARPLDEVLVGLDAEVRELARKGVLVTGRRGDAWYLDEAACIAWRDARPNRRARVALVIVLVVVAVVLLAVIAIVGGAPRVP